MKLELSRPRSVVEWTEPLFVFTGMNTLLRVTLVKEVDGKLSSILHTLPHEYIE